MTKDTVNINLEAYNELIEFREQIRAGKYVSIYRGYDGCTDYYYQKKEDLDNKLKEANKQLKEGNGILDEENTRLKKQLRIRITRRRLKKLFNRM